MDNFEWLTCSCGREAHVATVCVVREAVVAARARDTGAAAGRRLLHFVGRGAATAAGRLLSRPHDILGEMRSAVG